MSAILPHPYTHAECGMTRNPPNVEQISVRVEGETAYLRLRRNDVEMSLPLKGADCRHLCGLLEDAAAQID